MVRVVFRFRFRPFANPTPEEIDAYFRENHVPQLLRMGLAVPSLSDVSEKIEEILRERQVSDAMETWLQGVRSQARIEYFEPVQPGAEKGTRP